MIDWKEPFIKVPSRKRLLALQEIAATARRDYSLYVTLDSLSNRILTFSGDFKRLKQQHSQGVSLSESAKNCAGLFPKRYQPYLYHGDKTGRLPLMMTLLEGDYSRERAIVRNRVNALVYPFLLVIIITFLGLITLTKVVPVFEKLFADLGMGMIGGRGFWGHFARWWLFHYPFVMVAALVIVIAGVNISPLFTGLHSIHSLHERIPILGRAFHCRFWSKFIRMLGSLLREGVPINDAIGAASDVMGRRFLADACARLEGKIAEGQRLSEALRAENIFPESLVWTAAQGELTGKLPEHLLNQAENFDKVGRLMAERGMRVLEAFLLMVVAACAAMFVISNYLIIFGLSGIVI